MTSDVAGLPGIEALLRLGVSVGDRLTSRGDTVAVAEGASGGLVSAALLARPGASAYYVGGSVLYTPAATRGFVSGEVPTPPELRGATERFAVYAAESVARRLGTAWGVGEGGAAGPAGNPYGDPAGHAWVAVWGPATDKPSAAARHVLTGEDDRASNMVTFAHAALTLLAERLG